MSRANLVRSLKNTITALDAALGEALVLQTVAALKSVGKAMDASTQRMENPKSWVTISGAAVPMGEGGELGGAVGAKINASKAKKTGSTSPSVSEGARKVGITGNTVNVGGKDVVAENGKPKVFYHGGPATLQGGLHSGSFLTENKSVAQEYADQHEGGKVHGFNISVKNPASPKDIVKAADKAGINWDDVPGYFGPESKEMVAFSLVTPSQFDDANKVMAELKKSGHDGAAFPDDFSAISGKSTTSLMTFDPGQTIKAGSKSTTKAETKPAPATKDVIGKTDPMTSSMAAHKMAKEMGVKIKVDVGSDRIRIKFNPSVTEEQRKRIIEEASK